MIIPSPVLCGNSLETERQADGQRHKQTDGETGKRLLYYTSPTTLLYGVQFRNRQTYGQPASQPDTDRWKQADSCYVIQCTNFSFASCIVYRQTNRWMDRETDSCFIISTPVLYGVHTDYRQTGGQTYRQTTVILYKAALSYFV